MAAEHTETTTSSQAKDRHFLHPWENVAAIGSEARTVIAVSVRSDRSAAHG